MQYIDKTECLEKGIVVFPFIYIMGAPATGKSVAVQMLCTKHKDVKVHTVDLQHGKGIHWSAEEADKLLAWAQEQMEQEVFWLVLENVPGEALFYGKLAAWAQEMPENGRVILVGREQLPMELLDLYWKGRLEVIPQGALALSIDEIQSLKEMRESNLDAENVWRCTGGWAGCVDVLLRISAKEAAFGGRKMNVAGLMKRPEVASYVKHYIWTELAQREQQLLKAVMQCPWVNEELSREVLGFEDAKELLEGMLRKGYLICDYGSKRYKAAPLLEMGQSDAKVDMEKAGGWYEEHAYIREALLCLEKSGAEPQSPYLKGMQCFYHSDWDGMKQIIQKLPDSDVDPIKQAEIVLNLYYTMPEITLEEWLAKVEEAVNRWGEGKFQLYQILGNSCTYLCGYRDLTGLFSCGRKEENRRAKLWRKAFGEKEWKWYLLAKMDYYMETQRQEGIPEEAWELLSQAETEQVGFGDISEGVLIYLMGKARTVLGEEAPGEIFLKEYHTWPGQDANLQARTQEGISIMYTPWRRESGQLTKWLRNRETEAELPVGEDTYMLLWCIAKGYLLINQYKKAEKILKPLIPFLKEQGRGRFLAEAYLLQAMISWETDRRGHALQNIIESFYISGEARYVMLYSNYQKRAKEILEAYENWHQQTSPESWTNKKKYPYGNVLQMPMADYLSVIMRSIRKETRAAQALQTGNEGAAEEHLTMMETLVLQEISRGLTNVEICKSQNLKMPTVKTHIYSLYKKLGVNSRVQATIKGKELGILE